MNQIEQGYRGILRQAGYKLTETRLAVLNILRQQRQIPITAYEISGIAAVRGVALNVVTVYRVLDLCMHLGIVRRIHSDRDCHKYVLCEGQDTHHLVCRLCQRVTEFPCPGSEITLLDTKHALAGYKVEAHRLELVGICFDCQNQQEERNGKL